MIIYIRIWIRYIFVRNYDFIYMIMDNLTMSWLWYPNQWWLFIGTLIPKSMGVVHWYSDTQPMEVIHWYSNTQINGGGYSLVLWYPANGGYSLVLWCPIMGISMTIVIRLLRIWITLEYFNYFESLKLHMWFWKFLSIWTILSH